MATVEDATHRDVRWLWRRLSSCPSEPRDDNKQLQTKNGEWQSRLGRWDI